MKKLLVIAIALASTNAFASRARYRSLGNAQHIMDTQRIYINPSDVYAFGDFVNLESGSTAQGTEDTNTEGLVVRSYGENKFGLALGHRSDNASSFGLRNSALVSGTIVGVANDQQNPVELTYGFKSGESVYGVTAVYSNYNDKQNKIKETSGGIRLGMRQGAFDGALGIGLGNTVKAPGVDFKGTIGVNGLFGYTMENLYYYGRFSLAGAKNDLNSAGVTKIESNEIQLGVLSTHKVDGNEFFMGASLVNNQADVTTPAGKDKVEEFNLPVIVGMEVQATSWLTLRGSLTQTVFIDNSKDEVPPQTSEFAPGANNTVASIGAGLNFNKIQIDGNLQGLTGDSANQNIDGDSLLTTVGLTYTF